MKTTHLYEVIPRIEKIPPPSQTTDIQKRKEEKNYELTIQTSALVFLKSGSTTTGLLVFPSQPVALEPPSTITSGETGSQLFVELSADRSKSADFL